MTHDSGTSLEMDSAVAVRNRGYWGENSSCSQRTNIKYSSVPNERPCMLILFLKFNCAYTPLKVPGYVLGLLDRFNFSYNKFRNKNLLNILRLTEEITYRIVVSRSMS